MRVLAPITALLLVASCSSATKRSDGGRAPNKSADITLFFTTELKGTLEPCGCTSDPLGDIARTAAAIEAARKERPVALFDGGSTLYLDLPVPEDARAQAELTADAVARLLPDLGLQGAGLGPHDLGRGPEGVRFARDAVNVSGIPTTPPRIVEVGGGRVGVFGVVSPGAVEPMGLTASDPQEAARQAIATLRGDGAQLILALAHMPRADARRLARAAPGIDLLLVGEGVHDEGATPEAVGGTFLIEPGNRGQLIARLDLHLDAAGGALTDAIGPDRAAAEGARLEEKIARLQGDLDKWEKDPNAEAAFLARNREELASLQRERDALAASPLRAPETGSWFVSRPVRISRKLPCDPEIVSRKRALDTAIATANLAGAAAEPPPPAPGKPGFSGVEECGFCHKAAVEFWKKTRHAGAWETLEKLGKQANRDCVGCHVTGWQQPGGSTLAKNEALRDVQCENCHGPASLHVDADGKDKPRTVTRAPEPDLCATRCHTPEHSDTFQLEAYLRDVTGPGHGERLRKALGDGPTGHDLRSAALAKAGAEIGANCPK